MIYVIEDDESVRQATARLLRSAGLPVEPFASAEAFLRSVSPAAHDCLLVDIHLPGVSGLELHRQLKQGGCRAPVIFITALDDDLKRSEASSAGAAGYFQKPFDDQALLDAIQFALSGADR